MPAVLLSVHSTGKGGRLGGAALHANVGSCPSRVTSPRAIKIHNLQYRGNRIELAKEREKIPFGWIIRPLAGKT